MINFTGSHPSGRRAEIHQVDNLYSVYTWQTVKGYNDTWREIHNLTDWCQAFSIATKWLAHDFFELT